MLLTPPEYLVQRAKVEFVQKASYPPALCHLSIHPLLSKTVPGLRNVFIRRLIYGMPRLHFQDQAMPIGNHNISEFGGHVERHKDKYEGTFEGKVTIENWTVTRR